MARVQEVVERLAKHEQRDQQQDQKPQDRHQRETIDGSVFPGHPGFDLTALHDFAGTYDEPNSRATHNVDLPGKTSGVVPVPYTVPVR